MAKNKTIRVFPDGAVWVVKKDGAARAWAVRNTKEEALKAAKDVAIKQGLALLFLKVKYLLLEFQWYAFATYHFPK